MRTIVKIALFVILTISLQGCFQPAEKSTITAAEILGNPEYLAFSYGGFRQNTRAILPTVEELKEDMKILAAMNVKLLRTYNTQLFGDTVNLLEAIRQLKEEDATFEMYIMLGVWIECEGAFTKSPNHSAENIESNTSEIEMAVLLSNEYPDIVKIIAVGNEAMVHWAASYFVTPDIILKWVNHLQELKKSEKIPKNLWITSSDNFASWGGGTKNYQTKDLEDLIKAVDYVSLHTYPFHDSHYNPDFWLVPKNEEDLSDLEKIDAAMLRAKGYAVIQYQSAKDYIASLGIEKPIHIGETGWASIAASSYGATGSKAADEYKEKLFYQYMRDWTTKESMSCFYFEAFDEPWKDKSDPLGSENHFGLINIKGQVKYALWDEVDSGTFEGLTRNGFSITKTYNGDETALMKDVLAPPLASEMGMLQTSTFNNNRNNGELVTESIYVVLNDSLVPNKKNNMTYPSSTLKPNAWEGTCSIELSKGGVLKVFTGTGDWWGSALELQGDNVEDLSNFKNGHLHLDIKGETKAIFNVGFQTGRFADGDQINNYISFGPNESYSISPDWKSFSIPVPKMNKKANFKNVTSLIYFIGESNFDGKTFEVKNIYYTQD